MVCHLVDLDIMLPSVAYFSPGLITLLSPCHNALVIHTGGVPEAILTLSDHRYRGYEGCIGDVRIQDSGYVNLGQKSLSGKNVASCNR